MSNQQLSLGIADERLLYVGEGRARISFSVFNGKNFGVEILGIGSVSIEGQGAKFLASNVPDVIAPNQKVHKWIEIELPIGIWLGIEAGTANEKLNTEIQIQYAYPYKKLIS